MLQVDILTECFDPWQRVSEYQEKNIPTGKHGACNVFIGSMRDFNEGDQVQAMTLEHYPGMTEKYLHDIAGSALDKWDIIDVLILHRIGEVTPNDTIVVVAVWSAHRAHAYEACRYLMEELKSRAPFWKKETLAGDQTRWVEKNTSGQVE